MLEFVDVCDSPSEKVELDYYVPLTIRWGDQEYFEHKNFLMMEPKLYWSLGDNKSLLEVGIDPPLKIIRFFKVVIDR